MMENEEKFNEFIEKITKVREYKDPETIEKKLREKLEKKEIDLDEYIDEIKKLTEISKEERFWDLRIKHLANHYYVPLILSEREKTNYIKPS